MNRGRVLISRVPVAPEIKCNKPVNASVIFGVLCSEGQGNLFVSIIKIIDIYIFHTEMITSLNFLL